jgi:hypothetical protein
LYWKRDGVLKAPANKMAEASGRLTPEKVHNFDKHITYFMLVFPLVYWKIICRETNVNSQDRLAMQVSNNGKKQYMELDGPMAQRTKI